MKKNILTLLSNPFMQGGILLTASNFLVGGINYAFNLLAGRALGPEGYGEIATLFSYISIFSIPIGILGTLLIQKIGSADDAFSYTRAIHQWTIQRFKSWWWILAVGMAITPFIPKLTNLAPVTGYALPILILLGILGIFYGSSLQALHLFFWVAILGVLGVIIKLSGATIAFFGAGGLEIIIVMIVISGIVQLVASHYVFRKAVKKHTATIVPLQKRMRDLVKDRQLWYTAGVTGALTLISNIDIIYVKLYFPAEDAGLFGAWSLFAKIILYVLGPLLGLSYIFFSNKKESAKHHLVFIVAFILFVVLGFVANMGYGFFGRLMVESLFGKEFISVLPFIEWASLFGSGYVMMMFMMNYFLAKKSMASLVPAMIFPFYLLALFMYPQGIGDVMFIDTIFTFTCVGIFLFIFFKERFSYLLELLRQ
ncbi:MAG: oligosaccharide flippase family protein [Candidatus Magasanikbacteria bacterium]|nr:oligosaccharide flippase family protein [Candidatus Magasanikbacteria bacterium]